MTPRERKVALTLTLALVGCAASTPAPAPDLAPPPPSAAAPAPVEPAPQPVAVASSAVPVAPVASASVAPAPAASAPAASPPEGLPAFGAGKGTASFSNPNNKGSCSLNPPTNHNTLSASRNIYQSIQACGACLEITGGAGTAVVQVMDLCFSCPDNSVVISKPAFEATVGKQSGTGDISWKTVPCPVETKVTVRIKESSSRHWTAVQIRDSKLPLKSVSLQRDGESDWVTLERSADNYWAAAKGAGEGGFKLRIVAANGQQIEESVAKGWKDGKVYPGANQF